MLPLFVCVEKGRREGVTGETERHRERQRQREREIELEGAEGVSVCLVLFLPFGSDALGGGGGRWQAK